MAIIFIWVLINSEKTALSFSPSPKLKKRVIVVPRLGKYKEQNNDHQVQIMERYDKLGYIIPCTDLDDLDKIVKESHNFIPKEYKADKQGIIKEIKEFIDRL